MSVRSILVVLLALVCGGSAALGIRAFLRHVRADAPAETLPVVVAAEDVARFQALTPDLLVIRNYPKDLVPQGCMQSLEEALDRATFVSLGKGEPIRTDKLGAKGAGRGMGSIIPRGMRAFTVNTPSIAAHVAGFILPGSKVDVLLTVKTSGADDGTGGTATTTILQNIEILAVDQRVEAPSSGKVDLKDLRSVTLLVTPEQADRLANGQNSGTLHLTLRNPGDTAETVTPPATLAELKLTKVAPPPEKKEEKKEPDKETVRQANYPTPPPTPPVVRTLRGIHPGEVELR
jgi:pilus assembly protein CpaB